MTDIDIAQQGNEANFSSLLDRIGAAADIESHDLLIPEWGVTIQVRAPSMKQRAQLIEANIAERGGVDAIAASADVSMDMTAMQFRILQACCFDPATGSQVFGSDGAFEVLSKKNGRVVWDLFRVCQKLAGMAGEDEAAVLDAGKDG